jgi:lipase chaperone LimK
MKQPIRHVAVVLVLAAVGVGVLRGGGIHSSSPSPPREHLGIAAPTPRRPPPALDVSGAGGLRRAQPSNGGEVGPLPHSLEGTDVDGWLGSDDDGHLVVTPGARWFFDYFLSATGEESDDDIRARIIAEIEKRLPAPGAHEAVDLLDRYLGYRDRVRALQVSGAADDLPERLAQLHDIRRDIFGAANAEVLFGEEEQVQAVDAQRRQLLDDESISPDDRERRLQALDQQLPPDVRAARAGAMAVVHLAEDEQQLRGAGASDQEIHALREQRFGAEAADRLDALDRERAVWQQRLDDYRHDRQAIDGNTDLTAAARAQAIDSLRAERFTSEERVHVQALDGQ